MKISKLKIIFYSLLLFLFNFTGKAFAEQYDLYGPPRNMQSLYGVLPSQLPIDPTIFDWVRLISARVLLPVLILILLFVGLRRLRKRK